MSLKPMTGKTPSKTNNTKSLKLKASIKTTTVENLNLNFVTWDDMKDGKSIVFELNGEFRKNISEQNKNWVFENYYTKKAVVVDTDENVIKIIEALNDADLIQIPCQQSHRQGIKDLIELGETVAMYSDLRVNSSQGTTYYNCNVSSLNLESLDEFEN